MKKIKKEHLFLAVYIVLLIFCVVFAEILLRLVGFGIDTRPFCKVKINGVNYLLVLDDIEDEEAEALILKDMSEEAESDAVYEIVDDETELTAIAKVFEELLDDMELVTGENDSDDEE